MHTIRLRGPWELEPVSRYVLQGDGSYRAERQNLPAPTKMKMPADWSEPFGADFLGRVCYRRFFQKPTGLDSGERVWLVVEPARSEASVILNGEMLGMVHWGQPALRFDITDRLDDHNRLVIFVDHPASEGIENQPGVDAHRRKFGDPKLLGSGGLVGEVRLEIEE